MRGRDIKKYGYEFADQYIIATFPSRKYNIDEYQSLKSYFLSFGIEKLEQTGKEYIINGEIVKARKKTNNKWFETQDSISYWDEFSKPKIVWGNLNTFGSYAIAPENMFINAPACMIVPGNTYLLAVLNSKIADYYLRTLGVVRNGRISSAVLTRSSSSMQFARISSRFSDVMINASLHPVKTPLYISTSHSLRGTPTDSTLHLILCSISLSIVQDSLLNDDF